MILNVQNHDSELKDLRYCPGVAFMCFLNTVLNDALELKPAAKPISSNERVLDVWRSDFTFSTRNWLM